jgi:hypothetical protein
MYTLFTLQAHGDGSSPIFYQVVPTPPFAARVGTFAPETRDATHLPEWYSIAMKIMLDFFTIHSGL